MTYLFAYSFYGLNNQPFYCVVDENFEIHTKQDWKDFFQCFGKYCEKSIKYYEYGYYTANPDKEVFTHAYYSKPFIFTDDNSGIIPLSEKDITPYENERCPEKAYFDACTTWNERNA